MNDSPGTLHVPGRVGALDPTRGAWGELLLSTPLVGGPGDAENREQLCKSAAEFDKPCITLLLQENCFHQQHPTF